MTPVAIDPKLWLLKTPSVAAIQGFRSGSGDGYGMPQLALDRIGSSSTYQSDMEPMILSASPFVQPSAYAPR